MEKPTGVIQKIIESLQQVNALDVYSPIEKDIILHNLRAAYMIFLNIPVTSESTENRVEAIAFETKTEEKPLPEEETATEEETLPKEEEIETTEAVPQSYEEIDATETEQLPNTEMEEEFFELEVEAEEPRYVPFFPEITETQEKESMEKFEDKLEEEPKEEIGEKSEEVIEEVIEEVMEEEPEEVIEEEIEEIMEEKIEEEPEEEIKESIEEEIDVIENVEEIIAVRSDHNLVNEKGNTDIFAPVLHDDILELIPDAKPHSGLLFDEITIPRQEKKSLNDLLVEKKEEQTLGTRFQQSFIPDLTKAIAINEKFTFIRELFHNSGVDFSNAIQKLNECDNIDTAFFVMEELKHRYLWDTTSASYLSLCDLVRRRFM